MNTHNAWQVDGEARRLLEAVGLTDPNMLVGRGSQMQQGSGTLCAWAVLSSPVLRCFECGGREMLQECFIDHASHLD
jgi:hypothetical protein